MSIYISNDKAIKHYCTNQKTDKAIITLIEQIEDVVKSDIKKGYRIRLVDDDNEQKDEVCIVIADVYNDDCFVDKITMVVTPTRKLAEEYINKFRNEKVPYLGKLTYHYRIEVARYSDGIYEEVN